MRGYLDGLLPLAVALILWSLVFDREITALTVLVMAISTVCYREAKIYFTVRQNSGDPNG